MKIVLAHNYYGAAAPSGENAVFEAERELLASYGHEVIAFTRHSDTIRERGAAGAVIGALSTPWNPFARRSLRELLVRERPEVVHVHNSFPLLSPSIYFAAQGLPAATVLTLHNFRTFCAAGVPLRGSAPCTECLDRRSVLPALRYGCYRDSRAATVPMALMIALHRRLRTWERQVDALIALTEFQRDTLVNAGLPRDRVYVKPHFYPNPPRPMPWGERDAKVVFMGRLGAEKGIHVLIEAWRRWGASAPPLELIGDGPERANLETAVAQASLGDRVIFAGQLPFAEAQERLAHARLLVLPSLCFEGFPMVIREAFALGVPVAASRLGSMPCLVTPEANGALFAPGDPDDLLATVRAAWEQPATLQSWGEEARAEFDRKFTADANYEMLMEIYAKAIEHRRRRLANARVGKDGLS